MRRIKAGTRVRLKVPTIQGTKGVGTLMYDVVGDDLASVMMDAGATNCTRDELAVLRDQTPGPVPMRHRLPYGKWTCDDGREVLFNRDYEPIWTRRPGEAAQTADPNDRGPHCRRDMYWSDSNAPWHDRESLARTEAILVDWLAASATPSS